MPNWLSSRLRNREAAIIATLPAGAHTAILRGGDNGTGIGIVEVYELGAASIANLANLSTRGYVKSGDNLLIGGDVLFAGGVGRWDLPGGDVDLLFNGIRQKLFPLGDNVSVLPGHGPPTKIGTERQTNPFVS